GAEIDLPDLPPGSYDVVLYDYAQEVGRLPGALKVLPNAPLPNLTVDVSGAFTALDASGISALKAGMRLPTEGETQAEILSVGKLHGSLMRIFAGPRMLRVPVEARDDLPATLRVHC